jgi:histidinol-phosphate aminotransferase
MTKLVKAGHNVIVSKTFSKVYGLAGLRVGYLVARPDIAQRLIRNRVAFTNVLALQAASTAIDEQSFYEYSLQKNEEAKTMIYETLDDLGLEYIPSHTNFVFFKTGRDIGQVIPAMHNLGVAIGRPFPPLTEWCRISTGTIEETGRFNTALRKLFS